MKKYGNILAAILILVVLVGFTVQGYSLILPKGAPASQERETTLQDVQGTETASFDRMLTHVRAITKEPHVSGSRAIEEVRSYLKTQLSDMGYSFETEDHSLTVAEMLAIRQRRADARGKAMRATEESIRNNADMGDAQTLDLQNILVKLDAPQTDRAVLVVTHYDSVKFGPGAGDDALAVASALEALRLLQGRSDLKNDMYFLFTDGEEQGLLGAACFVDKHPELQPLTDLVFNIEARGNRGALLMFETSDNNLELIRHYQKGVPTRIGFSVASQVYKMMSNDTDLSEFLMAGYPGLNFAIIEGAEHYHSETDNYDTFDRATAAHFLETITGFSSYLATADLSGSKSGQDAVFFPLLRGNVVVMSSMTANILAWAAALLAIVWIAWLFLRRKIGVKEWATALGLQLAALAVTALVGFGADKLVRVLFDLSETAALLRVMTVVYWLLMLLSVVLSALAMGLAARITKNPSSVLAGVTPLFVVAAVGTSFVFDAATYLFSLPLLGLLLCSVLSSMVKGRAAFWARAVGFLVAGGVTLLVFVPLIHLVFVALTMPMVSAALLVLPMTAFFAMALPLLAKRKTPSMHSRILSLS